MGNLWVATPLKKKNTSLFQQLSVISRALRKGRALWVPSSVHGQTLKGPNPLQVSCRKFQLLRVHEGNDITTRRQHSPMLLIILIFLVLELFFFLWAGVCLLTGSFEHLAPQQVVLFVEVLGAEPSLKQVLLLKGYALSLASCFFASWSAWCGLLCFTPHAPSVMDWALRHYQP